MDLKIKDNDPGTTIELDAGAAALVFTGGGDVEVYLPQGSPAPITANMATMLGFLLDESNNDLGFELKSRFEARMQVVKENA